MTNKDKVAIDLGCCSCAAVLVALIVCGTVLAVVWLYLAKGGVLS